MYSNPAGSDSYNKHLSYLSTFYQVSGKPLPEFKHSIKTDYTILAKTHRFIRTDKDDEQNEEDIRLAKAYYSKLYRTFCLADLSRWEEKKIGMRWRTEQEVLEGKGQFICGALNCNEVENLTSYEVQFSYRENHENKQALVKLRVCPQCAKKLWPNLPQELPAKVTPDIPAATTHTHHSHHSHHHHHHRHKSHNHTKDKSGDQSSHTTDSSSSPSSDPEKVSSRKKSSLLHSSKGSSARSSKHSRTAVDTREDATKTKNPSAVQDSFADLPL